MKRYTSHGFEEIETKGTNDLPKGTVLQLNGYDNPRSVIMHNDGINEKSPSYGSRYLTIDLDDYSQHKIDAYQLQFIDKKNSNRIQTYITDEIKSENEIAEIWAKSETLRQARESAQHIAVKKTQQHIIRGRKLFSNFISKEAKALIIAEQHEDNSNMLTDYFGHKTLTTVVLGWSKHTRDLFSEMRKHADRIPETAHLKIRPTKSESGEERTEENKAWWEAKDEHREKWSGGGGYYLKDGHRHKTGWSISKQIKWGEDWPDWVYISLSKRCVLIHEN